MFKSKKFSRFLFHLKTLIFDWFNSFDCFPVINEINKLPDHFIDLIKLTLARCDCNEEFENENENIDKKNSIEIVTCFLDLFKIKTLVSYENEFEITKVFFF